MTTYAQTIKPESFIPGTQVGAYLAAGFTADDARPVVGAADATATVASDGSVVFTGLTYAADYIATETPGSEVRSLTVDATGGTFNLASGDENQDLAFNISAANLKTAIVALLDATAADVTVTGGPGDSGGTTPYVITFGGALANQAVPALTTDATSLTGGAHTASIATTTQGRTGGNHRVIFQAR